MSCYIGRVVIMSVSGYRNPASVCSVLEKTLYSHCFSGISSKCVSGGDNLAKGVHCYELFGGIVLKNHAYFYFYNCQHNGADAT